MIYLPVCYTVKDLFWLYGRREYTVAVCACVDAHSHTHTKVSVMTKHLPFRFNIWFLFSSPLCWDYPPQQLFKKMLLCRLKTFSLWSWGQRWRDRGGSERVSHCAERGGGGKSKGENLLHEIRKKKEDSNICAGTSNSLWKAKCDSVRDSLGW